MQIVVAYRGNGLAAGYETGASLTRAFVELGHSVHPYGTYFRTKRRLAERPLPERADLLVYCECNDDDPQYFELREYPAGKKIFWDFDINYYPIRTLRFIRSMSFDHVLYASAYYGRLIRLVHPSTYFLPYAADPALHHPLPDVPKTRDLALIGSPFPERIKLIKKLRSLGVQAELITGIYGNQMVKAVAETRIHLNLNVRTGSGLLVMRVWETLGVGSLLLTQDRDGIRYFFRDGQDLVLFDRQEALSDLVEELLHYPERIDRIVRQGHAAVMAQHTYCHRAKFMLGLVSQAECVVAPTIPTPGIMDVGRMTAGIAQMVTSKTKNTVKFGSHRDRGPRA